MKKKIVAIILSMSMIMTSLMGCGKTSEETQTAQQNSESNEAGQEKNRIRKRKKRRPRRMSELHCCFRVIWVTCPFWTRQTRELPRSWQTTARR